MRVWDGLHGSQLWRPDGLCWYWWVWGLPQYLCPRDLWESERDVQVLLWPGIHIRKVLSSKSYLIIPSFQSYCPHSGQLDLYNMRSETFVLNPAVRWVWWQLHRYQRVRGSELLYVRRMHQYRGRVRLWLSTRVWLSSRWFNFSLLTFKVKAVFIFIYKTWELI